MISGVVLTRNEAHNILGCIEALRPHVSEIILVDMESTDHTVALARPLVSKVLSHPRVPNFDAVRNLAIPEAKFDWLWFVDADERIPAETGRLVNQTIRERGADLEAIIIPFKNYFCGKWMQHCSWWPGYSTPRVLKRGHFKFCEELHAGVSLSGRELMVAPDPRLAVDHYSFRNIEHWVEKFNRYTTAEAINLDKRGVKHDWRSALRAMMKELFSYYERHQGHRDGVRGWVLSWLSGQYQWFNHAKLLDQPGAYADNRVESDVPPSIDAVLAVLDEELAIQRAPNPKLPLGIVWRCEQATDRFAAETRVWTKALGSKRAITIEPTGEALDDANLSRIDSALIDALSRARRPPYSIAITDRMPGTVIPDLAASMNILIATCPTDQIPEGWANHLAKFDEVWVRSEADRLAFRRGWYPPEKLRMVPRGVDTSIFQPKGPKFSLPTVRRKRFVFLSTTRWHWKDGWDVLLRAYAAEFNPSDGVALVFRIVNPSQKSMETLRLDAERVLIDCGGQTLESRPDICLLADPLSEEGLASLYRSANAFVLPQREMGWPQAIAEAQACGLPAIVSDRGSQAELVTNRTGSLVQSSMAELSREAQVENPELATHRWVEPDVSHLRTLLREYVADSKRAAALGKSAAKEIARQYGPEKLAADISARFKEVERRFEVRPTPPITNHQIRIEFEGELFARHSFSLANECLGAELIKDNSLAISFRRTRATRQDFPHTEKTTELLPYVNRSLADGPQLTIRHQYPPHLQRPTDGLWIHMQPWEYSAIPLTWLEPLRDQVDEIWACSNYVRRVFIENGVSAEKIHVVPLGFDPLIYHPAAPPLVLPTKKTFRFIYVGGTIYRKGFDLLLDAYLAEFTASDDVCLVVKDMGTTTFYRGANGKDRIRQAMADHRNPAILYYDEYLTEGQLASLYTACHCMPAPYRGEGFGLPILESIACGLAPIVTRGGSTDDFVTEETGYLLDAKRIVCEFPEPMSRTPEIFEVDMPGLRRALRHAFENRGEVAGKGRLGSERVHRDFTWADAVAKMRDRIGRLPLSPSRSDTESTPIDKDTTLHLSVCMIVRDNERTIRACLESIRPWVDEMIVVDTGSKDRTPDIARELGAKVFEFAWCDDFSAARNESLRHAQGEWLLWMDSDDTIDAENGAKLRGLLQNDPPSKTLGYVLQVHCPGPGKDGYLDVTVVDHVKLIRNRTDLRFEGRIHEQVLPSINRLRGDIRWTDIFVVHSGYDHSPEGQKRKIERDLRLLQLELAERPNHPFTLFNLGMTYSNIGGHVEAIDYLRRSISHSASVESHVRKAYALLVFSLKEAGQHDVAQQVCDDALRLFPDDVELRFRRGVLFQHAGQLRAAVALYQEVLDSTPTQRFNSMDRGIRGFKTRHNLAVLHGELGDLEAAEMEWRRIVAESPDYGLGWRGLGTILIRREKFDEARQLGERLVADPSQRPEGRILLGRLGAATGNLLQARLQFEAAVGESAEDDHEPLRRLCEFLFDHGDTDSAAEALSRLAELDPKDASAQHNLGTLHFRCSRFVQAIDAYYKALAVRPEFPQTWLYLGYALQSSGRNHEAIDAFERTLSLVPNGTDALAAQERLGQLKHLDGQQSDASENAAGELIARSARRPYDLDAAARIFARVSNDSAAKERGMLIQLATGSHRELIEITRAHHAAYCARHHLEYLVAEENLAAPKRASWGKIPLILEAMKRGFQRIVFLDADAIVIDPSVDLSQLVDDGVGIVRHPNCDRVNNHWNCGVMVIANQPQTRRFFALVNAEPENDNAWMEQVAVNAIAQQSEFSGLLMRLAAAYNSTPGAVVATKPVVSAAHGQPFEERKRLLSDWLAEASRNSLRRDPRCLDVESRNEFGELLNRLGLVGEAAEVGVLRGEFSRVLLDQWKGATLHLIDPWRHLDNYRDITNLSDKGHEAAFNEVHLNLRPHQGRYQVHRKLSSDAASYFKEQSLDFVYIDANHEYSAVLDDIRRWFPKVRAGGLIAGHDYLDGHLPEGEFGVKRAVRAFECETGLVVHSTCEANWKSWYLSKEF